MSKKISEKDIRRFIALRYTEQFDEDYFEKLKPLLGQGENTKSIERIPVEDAVRVRTEINDFLRVLGVKDGTDIKKLFKGIDNAGGFSTNQKSLFNSIMDTTDTTFTNKLSTYLSGGNYKVQKIDRENRQKIIDENIATLNKKGLDLGKSLLDQKLPKRYDFLSDDVMIGRPTMQAKTELDAGGQDPQQGEGEGQDEGEEKEDKNEEKAEEKPKLRGSGRKLTKEELDSSLKSQEKAKKQEDEGIGINPDTTTNEMAEGISAGQEGGEASTNQPQEVLAEAPPQQEEVQAEAQPQAQPNVTTEVVKQDQPPEGKENRINIGQQVDDIPKETKLSKIDESRFSTQFKTIAQLNEDIKYFISNFGNVLGKTLIEEYNKINKQNLAQVRRLHGKISGVLQTDKKKEIKIGIIIDADEYIREKINMVIAQNATTGLKASGLIINVEGQETKEGDKSIGNFDVRKARLGGSLAYQREPVYRFIPKSDPQDIDLKERKKPSGRGIQMLGTKRIDLVSTAIRQRANDPFAKSRNTIKLKYIY